MATKIKKQCDYCDCKLTKIDKELKLKYGEYKRLCSNCFQGLVG